MIRSIAILSILSLFLLRDVFAFPAGALENAAVKLAARSDFDVHFTRARDLLQLNEQAQPFDAASQLVSVSGSHAFVPPNYTAGDQRGICPGLNAMANHGYIPRNGVATIQQFVDGCFDAFGFGKDLGMLLSTYGGVMDGDLTRFSIGGPTPLVPSLLGLLGTPAGISANQSHNKYDGKNTLQRRPLHCTDLVCFSCGNFEQSFRLQIEI